MANSVTTDNSKDSAPASPHSHKKLKGRHFWDILNLGYLGAGVATMITAWESINGYFYANAKKQDSDGFEKHINNRDDELTSIKENYPTPAGLSKFQEIKRDAKIKNNAYRKYNRMIDEDFLSREAPKFEYKQGDVNAWDRLVEGIEVSYRKLQKIEPHERKKVWLQVAVVGSIALGAIYSFARERRYTENLEKQKEKTELIIDGERANGQRSR